ncbi:hypothetical protein [Lacipirellula sp.]|uniref:hypothetical protein n=1 Tax=Lacipirellula sp. TaxID=2691419 RepID=UPI003D11366E
MKSRAAVLLLALSIASGCAAHRVPTFDQSPANGVSHPLDDSPQIERGDAHPVVDGVGWVLGVPEKIALWDRRASNHQVSADTELKLSEYMAANGMGSTKVRINQYAPGDEWRRLAANKSVGAGWRYTFGAVRTLGYTILPGRVFSGLVGGDSYNPYTDSIYVYSDIPALAVEQGAHAKNVRWRDNPGTYASIYSLPILTLYPERAAKEEVYAHVAQNGTYDEQVAARDALYPQFGSEIGGQTAMFVPGSTIVFSLAGAGVGHAVNAMSPAPEVGMEPFAQAAAKYEQSTELADAPEKTTWPSDFAEGVAPPAAQSGEVRQANAVEAPSSDATILR